MNIHLPLRKAWTTQFWPLFALEQTPLDPFLLHSFKPGDAFLLILSGVLSDLLCWCIKVSLHNHLLVEFYTLPLTRCLFNDPPTALSQLRFRHSYAFIFATQFELLISILIDFSFLLFYKSVLLFFNSTF